MGSQIVAFHSLHQLQERHVGKRGSGSHSWEDEFRLVGQTPQHFDGNRRQGNAMLPVAFHALGGNRPDGIIKVDFIPACANDFARAASGQNEKFKPASGNGIALPQRVHECADFVVGQGGVVRHPPLDVVNYCGFWEG